MPSFRIRIRDENRKLSVAKKRFPSYVISQTCFRAVVFCARRYCRRLAARSRNYSRTDYGNGRGETFFQYHRSFHESRGTRMSVRNGEKSGHSLGIHFPESTIRLCCKKQRKRGKDRLYFLYSRVQNTRSLLSTSCRREKKKQRRERERESLSFDENIIQIRFRTLSVLDSKEWVKKKLPLLRADSIGFEGGTGHVISNSKNRFISVTENPKILNLLPGFLLKKKKYAF